MSAAPEIHSDLRKIVIFRHEFNVREGKKSAGERERVCETFDHQAVVSRLGATYTDSMQEHPDGGSHRLQEPLITVEVEKWSLRGCSIAGAMG